MQRRPPRSTLSDTLFPYSTRFLSQPVRSGSQRRRWGTSPESSPALASFGRRAASAGVRQPRVTIMPTSSHTGGPPARRRHMSERRRGHSPRRSEEHTSELQSLMRISYAVFCLKKKNNKQTQYQDD